MALTITSYDGFPHIERFTLGSSNIVTKVSLPAVGYAVRVALKFTTNVGKLGGANSGLADGDSIGTDYVSCVADQWHHVDLPPAKMLGGPAPTLYPASATGSTVVEMVVTAIPPFPVS